MNIKGLVSAVIVSIIVGFIVGALAYIVGVVPHLEFFRTYDALIGLGAGLVTFLYKWDQI